MDRALKRLKNKEHKFFILSGTGYTYRIDLYNLVYVEVKGHDLLFHLKDRQVPIQIRASLKKIEKQLDNRMFFKCSQGFLVNLEYVDEIRDGTAIVDGVEIPVTRTLRRDFIDALNDYMSEVR